MFAGLLLVNLFAGLSGAAPLQTTRYVDAACDIGATEFIPLCVFLPVLSRD